MKIINNSSKRNEDKIMKYNNVSYDQSIDLLLISLPGWIFKIKYQIV